jgi:hypothetical protein
MRSSVLFTLVVLSLLTLSFGPAPACEPEVACFDVSLSPVTLTGDIYVDGNLITTGVNNARLSLTPDVPHVIEFRAIQLPGEAGVGDLFIYPDQSRTQSGVAGQASPIAFRPLKQYLKGFLEITCTPRGRQATDNVACRPTIDGVPQADIAPNTKATYPLTPGAHALHTELVGDQANNWSPTQRDDTVIINAGRNYPQTTRLSALFTLKGLLKIVLLPKGLTADLYLNGALLASQASTFDVRVTAGTHTIEARSVTDPTANGQYVYADALKTATVSAASTRFVYLSPQKMWLQGFLNVSCQLNRKTPADDARCVVNSDGTDLGTVEALQTGKFNLPVGQHALSISTTGASAGRWDGPVNLTVNIVGGRNAFAVARFNQRPIPSPTPTLIAPPTATPTPAPLGTRGITGQLFLCNPKTIYAAGWERICFVELIQNHTGARINYGIFGVQATNLSGGPSQFQTSWSGDLAIDPGCLGPTNRCGGAWEDGMKMNAVGIFSLTLQICYSSQTTCQGGGEWEALTPGIVITVVH